MRIYKNEKGQKMYPVCCWEENHHKLYYFHDKVMIQIYEGYATEDDSLLKKLAKIEHLIDVFEANVINGYVYATWKDGLQIKEYIATYNILH